METQIIKEFISIWTTGLAQKTKRRAFQARAIGLCLIGRHPIHSMGGHSAGPGLNASFTFPSVLSMARPLAVSYVY
jgi:hypothetical protein